MKTCQGQKIAGLQSEVWSRIEIPRALHHIICRGIEGGDIFMMLGIEMISCHDYHFYKTDGGATGADK